MNTRNFTPTPCVNQINFLDHKAIHSYWTGWCEIDSVFYIGALERHYACSTLPIWKVDRASFWHVLVMTDVCIQYLRTGGTPTNFFLSAFLWRGTLSQTVICPRQSIKVFWSAELEQIEFQHIISKLCYINSDFAEHFLSQWQITLGLSPLPLLLISILFDFYIMKCFHTAFHE